MRRLFLCLVAGAVASYPAACLSSDEVVGQVVQIDENRARAAVRFPDGALIETGDLFRLQEPSASSSSSTTDYLSVSSCTVTVIETHRTNPQLARHRENVVVVDMSQCRLNSMFVVGATLVPSLLERAKPVVGATQRDTIRGEQSSRSEHAKSEIHLSGLYGQLALSENTTALRLASGLSYLVAPGVQLGFSTSWERSDLPGLSLNASSVLVGPTINFPVSVNLESAVFLTGGIGFTQARVDIPALGISETSTNFTFAFSMGKRFPIANSIVYRPSVGIVKVDGAKVSFVLSPIAFSGFF